jgi:hypothetical protein
LYPQLTQAPLQLKEALVCFAHNTPKFQVTLDEEQAVFLVGLEPHKPYTIEVDDEEMFEATTDSGGILVLTDVPRSRAIGVRIK